MTDAKDIIVVDDEPALRMMVEDYLSSHELAVRGAENGNALDRALAERPADIVLLDINMPGESGLEVLARLRRTGARMGIILLTANGDEASKLVGLGNGADDYIVKPFELRELLARIRAVSRRLPAPAPTKAARTDALVIGPFKIDQASRRLLDPYGAVVETSVMEYELLETFARHPRQILSRDRLCELAHGRPLGDGDRSVDIRIARLRKKLDERVTGPDFLLTVRGQGYVYEPLPKETASPGARP